MAKRPRNQLEEIAQQIVKDAGLNVEVGEYEFISTAVRLIQPRIAKWYTNAQLTPPTTATISGWFYRNPPGWAIAFLVNEYQSEKILL